MVRQSLMMVAFAAAGVAGAADFHAADLTPLAASQVRRLEPDKIAWLADGKAKLPIVCGGTCTNKASRSVRWNDPAAKAAKWLAATVKEMTGVAPNAICLMKDEKPPMGPAIYVGDVFAKAAGIECPDAKQGAFRAVSKDGSLYFCGRTEYGVYDFAERVLGVRHYWVAAEKGRSVVKASTLSLPEIDYSDQPVFPMRYLWPKTWWDCYQVWKAGDQFRLVHQSHAPSDWHTDTNFNYKVTRPEIFELTRAGKRAVSPMLCYGHPKTLETYVERLELELKGGPKCGFYQPDIKVVTVQQWDALIDCQCEYCKPQYDEKMGPAGNASALFYGFVRKLSDILAKSHPDITICISAYLNTCLPPARLAFPAGNVQGNVCVMPGFAMLKDPRVIEAEEGLIRKWAAVTPGRKMRTTHYSCWPAEFCAAPFVYGHVIQDHFRRLRDINCGTFFCGPYPTERLQLSAYVLARVLWNPDVDVEAIYDTFAARMFSAGAKPMRKLIAMQEAGWMRKWNVPQVSVKNTYEISYPRAEVLEMQQLFAEAKALADGDADALEHIAWYEKGFKDFFAESEKVANGVAMEDSYIQKVASDPILDGKLDDEAWTHAKAYPLVRSRDKQRPQPTYPTEVRLVWTPNGVTVGYRCTEPNAGDAAFLAECRARGAVEFIDTFIDVTGAGDGGYRQMMMDDSGRMSFYTEGPGWNGKGIQSAVHFGQGFWSVELFIPFSAIKDIPGAQFPEGTTAAGKFWLGNFCRARIWDSQIAKDKRRPGSERESSRRYTQYSQWNKDPSAFGKLQFVE